MNDAKWYTELRSGTAPVLTLPSRVQGHGPPHPKIAFNLADFNDDNNDNEMSINNGNNDDNDFDCDDHHFNTTSPYKNKSPNTYQSSTPTTSSSSSSAHPSKEKRSRKPSIPNDSSLSSFAKRAKDMNSNLKGAIPIRNGPSSSTSSFSSSSAHVVSSFSNLSLRINTPGGSSEGPSSSFSVKRNKVRYKDPTPTSSSTSRNTVSRNSTHKHLESPSSSLLFNNSSSQMRPNTSVELSDMNRYQRSKISDKIRYESYSNNTSANTSANLYSSPNSNANAKQGLKLELEQGWNNAPSTRDAGSSYGVMSKFERRYKKNMTLTTNTADKDTDREKERERDREGDDGRNKIRIKSRRSSRDDSAGVALVNEKDKEKVALVKEVVINEDFSSGYSPSTSKSPEERERERDRKVSGRLSISPELNSSSKHKSPPNYNNYNSNNVPSPSSASSTSAFNKPQLTRSASSAAIMSVSVSSRNMFDGISDESSGYLIPTSNNATNGIEQQRVRSKLLILTRDMNSNSPMSPVIKQVVNNTNSNSNSNTNTNTNTNTTKERLVIGKVERSTVLGIIDRPMSACGKSRVSSAKIVRPTAFRVASGESVNSGGRQRNKSASIIRNSGRTSASAKASANVSRLNVSEVKKEKEVKSDILDDSPSWIDNDDEDGMNESASLENIKKFINPSTTTETMIKQSRPTSRKKPPSENKSLFVNDGHGHPHPKLIPDVNLERSTPIYSSVHSSPESDDSNSYGHSHSLSHSFSASGAFVDVVAPAITTVKLSSPGKQRAATGWGVDNSNATAAASTSNFTSTSNNATTQHKIKSNRTSPSPVSMLKPNVGSILDIDDDDSDEEKEVEFISTPMKPRQRPRGSVDERRDNPDRDGFSDLGESGLYQIKIEVNASSSSSSNVAKHNNNGKDSGMSATVTHGSLSRANSIGRETSKSPSSPSFHLGRGGGGGGGSKDNSPDAAKMFPVHPPPSLSSASQSQSQQGESTGIGIGIRSGRTIRTAPQTNPSLGLGLGIGGIIATPQPPDGSRPDTVNGGVGVGVLRSMDYTGDVNGAFVPVKVKTHHHNTGWGVESEIDVDNDIDNNDNDHEDQDDDIPLSSYNGDDFGNIDIDANDDDGMLAVDIDGDSFETNLGSDFLSLFAPSPPPVVNGNCSPSMYSF